MLLTRIVVTSILAIALTASAHASAVAKKSGAKLSVIGDDGPNLISLTSDGSAGEVVVEINGAPLQSFIGVRDIVIATGGGDDSVDVRGIHIGGSLKVKTGSGGDSIRLSDVSSPTKRELFIGRNVDLDLGGQSNDRMDFESVTNAGISIGGNVTIRRSELVSAATGSGAHTMDTADLRIGGDLVVRAAKGVEHSITIDSTSVCGATRILMGSEFDSVTLLRSTFVGNVTIALGGSGDAVEFQSAASQCRFESAVVVDGGPGNDNATALGGIFAQPITFKQFEGAP
ncbi:MAG: hypothetical protein IPH13_05580 [Planctomycetes bacterium]|nr:hypothetical protein [Planctomycetota bacterium]MCC7172442.1 hypothetical protein [Planctomycetota bacterium]